MKRIVLASASLLVLSALAPASAADLAARPYTKAPVAVASIYNWSGFYIGGNAGGGSSHNCWDLTAVGVAAIPVTAEGCHNATGALVGGQIGYRWQSSSWVFGLEAQGDWADLKGSNVSAPAALFPLVNNTKIDAIGLFTGQVGYAWNNVLWYVKGGAAVTHNKFSGTLAGITLDTANETRWGGTVGTGIEFGFAPNWSVAVEYNHLFMGKHTDTFTFLGVATRSDSIKQDVDMGTVRLNYTFGGPVVAKY
ncbi:outer membrane immunogenic protein [Bradyrhizobium diazoefficiens]|jgi:outer membrane immunogenic protein|uniref:Blr4701 protein n=1 Tax=Bradyrhizobium diazoefficiens (strain JCM 10833 / BCRC 13528 / IAM 13628 / NBRC 14792 / USDA 110) TaxID=224911 RepID=Q89L47_BRADU|nr:MULTISPECIES: outer membrane beta-barrel protein [Bradyrhizobium]MBP1065202.1 outer membrane immunogenic protein [Bradyrhizobium japonicum]AND89964.1 membrane protein [Bradyrhizobium diazoefficiens USDA 110]AWO91637.1 porin family protein [Bradyrhizobium diazoefficiens]MBP1092551.1 outer membrane immunogenic protein [Bradyrhizobium japonicum]MDA9396473.1 membrane protein [Bradyrhizobium sp. CCBAU 45394]